MVNYTVAALIGVLAALALDLGILRTRLVFRRSFWTSYAIVLIGQLVVNGVLTGRGVVRYDPGTILGLRIINAPVEDLAFGFSLVVQTMAWWTYWGRRGIDRTPAEESRDEDRA